MDAEYWSRVERLFLEASALPESGREALLAAAEPDLAAEVRSLLAAETGAEAFFARPTGALARALAPSTEALAALAGKAASGADDLRPGDAAGPYRVLEEVGRGGMGTVYRAERADGAFEKTVALKVVRRGLDTADVLGRFRRERALLASLEHPNVARLLDGGSTDDGRPWLALEFVEGGRPITAWADERRLGVEARLRLFLQACDAVAFAHRRLVVHRDLKPGNILVTEGGRVKLLDFGIAKLLDDTDGGDEVLTRAGHALLTPGYAAPEQVRGEAVTTAADVYGLGVVLYELLAGRRPGSDPPDRPSTAVVSAAAAGRATSAARLRRQLAGDLDRIVLKALHENPERRYPSAEALSDDLRRYLGGLPVRARPDSAAYRAAKFVRRNRFAVAGGALFIVLLIAFAIVSVTQQRATERALVRAEHLTQQFVGIFESADPDRGGNADLTVIEALDQGVERLREELREQPAIRASLLTTIASVYVNLGRPAEAVPLAEEALRDQRAGLPRGHPDLAGTLTTIATAYFSTGNYDAAEPLFREALAIRERALGPDHPDTAETRDNLASLLEVGRGDYATALPLRERATATYRRAAATDPIYRASLATSVNNLAGLHYARGAYVEAESAYEESLNLRRSVLAAHHPHIGQSLNNLAAVKRMLGDVAGAEALHLEALEIVRHAYGPAHPLVATTLNYVGIVQMTAGRTAEAAATLSEVLALRTAALGPAHIETLTAQNNVASVYRALGDLTEAERTYRAVVAGMEEAVGPEHPYTVTITFNLATVIHDAGRTEEAEGAYRALLPRFASAYPAGSPEPAKPRLALGRLLADTGRPAEAEPLLREAVALREAAFPAGHPETAEARSALGGALSRLGRYAEAEPMLRSALDEIVAARGPEHPSAAASRRRLAALYTAWSRPDDAARYQE